MSKLCHKGVADNIAHIIMVPALEKQLRPVVRRADAHHTHDWMRCGLESFSPYAGDWAKKYVVLKDPTMAGQVKALGKAHPPHMCLHILDVGAI